MCTRSMYNIRKLLNVDKNNNIRPEEEPSSATYETDEDFGWFSIKPKKKKKKDIDYLMEKKYYVEVNECDYNKLNDEQLKQIMEDMKKLKTNLDKYLNNHYKTK